MQNKWKSDMYCEIKMVHKRTKHHYSAYKDKETIKNTLQNKEHIKTLVICWRKNRRLDLENIEEIWKNSWISLIPEHQRDQSMYPPVVSNYGSSILYLMLMKYILKQKMRRQVL